VPSTRRWSVSHQRIEISVALGAIGTFLICGGVGMTNWVVSGFGVGLVAAGASIFGLSAINSRSYSFTLGTGHVLRASDPTASRGYGRCSILMVVHAKNIDGHRVKIRDDRVPIAKWPSAGVDLPIQVDVDDPRRVRVIWTEVPTHVQAAATRAQEAASYVGEPAYVATAEAGTTGFDPSGYGGGYDGTDPPTGDAGVAETATGVRFDEPTTEMSEDDLEETMSGSVLEFDLDPLVVTDDRGTGTNGPGRRRPSPRPRRPSDDTIAGPDSAASDGTDADATATSGGAAATAPYPRSPADTDDPLAGVGSRSRVDKMWDIPDTPGSATGAEAAESGGVAAPTPQPEAAHPVLRVDQAHVVTERVTATPDSDTDARYDQDDDAEVATIYLATSPPPGTPRQGRIRSVAATMLVTNLDRSIAFYRDVLGFTELASGYPGVLLGSGEARIVLRVAAVPEPVDRRLVQLLLEVPDVDAAYRDLRDRGVSFIHRPRPVSQYEQLTLWAAAMHDPDGHGIAIAQWRPSR
jgi:catechol 2,3-dioxygenase-like lactoylglutathione lyase family enzyme